MIICIEIVSLLAGGCTMTLLREPAPSALIPDVPIAYPTPTGPHSVGVHDFEFTDSVYPSDRPADAHGRRIMVRVWYPADRATGERRRYFADGEFQALAMPMLEVMGMGNDPDSSLLRPLGEVWIHSYVDAPLHSAQTMMPVVVYSHGGLSYLSQNTALMEELASHGYLVFSVTHPGGSVGIRYPNGDTIRYDAAYHQAVFDSIVTHDPEGLNSRDIAKRYAARSTRHVDDGGLGPWLPRWRDDNIALVDFIENHQSDDNSTGLLGEILARADLGRLAYGGMSYGAAAAASAAQADPRAGAAFNLDGTHHASDLLDTDIRVPLLAFTTEPVAHVPYTNEFFFEPLTTMGSRADIVRVWIPDIIHAELNDIMFFPAAYRTAIPGGGQGDGQRIHEILRSFLLAFLNQTLQGEANGYPASQWAEFPEVEKVDLHYVQAWANAQQ